MAHPHRTRRVAVVTTSRSDYGILYWVLQELRSDPRVELQLIVTGMHFSPRHGSTYRRILADGFTPAAQVRVRAGTGTDQDVANAIGRITIGIARAFQELRPAIAVMLGDRYELLGAAAAATAFRIPIVHLAGGETTEGSIDEAVRHAVTKMSHIHLVAARPYAERVKQMGEEPWRVRVVGTPALDHLRRTKMKDFQQILRRLDVPVEDARPLFLITLHPVTLEPGSSRALGRALVRALRAFDARVVITAPNADQENLAIFELLSELVHRGSVIRFVPDLGTAAYWGLLRSADVVIGNSSSGLIEAPSFGIPVVNIGDRQRGRLRSVNVIDVPPTVTGIRRGIARALTPAFCRRARRARNAYGGPGASRRIARIIATVPIGPRLLQKKWSRR